MRLERDECAARLAVADHAVLATLHPRRGVDAVPVCFAIDGVYVVVPVDRVKPKRSTRVQRTANLDADPRATLLVDQWDSDDWSRLWWVRATLQRVAPPTGRRQHHEQLLVGKYRQYRRYRPDDQGEDSVDQSHSVDRSHRDDRSHSGQPDEADGQNRDGEQVGSNRVGIREDAGPFVELLVFRVTALTGWSA